MNDVDVECKVKVYEVDGKDVPIGAPTEHVAVRSHWNIGRLVVLVVGGKTYTVHGGDLARAIGKAGNP